jgi:aldehyde dehydrogenase (NAD+)
VGGDWDEATRYFAPTVITGVDPESPLMQEEIFGPILPVLETPDLDAALAFVDARPKPLALYVFTGSRATAERVLARSTSGGACINDTVLHFAHPRLPGGGVNASGLGKGHGRFGFETFSNMRAILRSPVRYSPAQWLYPPFTAQVRRIVDAMLRFL